MTYPVKRQEISIPKMWADLQSGERVPGAVVSARGHHTTTANYKFGKSALSWSNRSEPDTGTLTLFFQDPSPSAWVPSHSPGESTSLPGRIPLLLPSSVTQSNWLFVCNLRTVSLKHVNKCEYNLVRHNRFNPYYAKVLCFPRVGLSSNRCVHGALSIQHLVRYSAHISSLVSLEPFSLTRLQPH